MNCRHCSAALSEPFLDLGTSPPSNAYLSARQLAAPEVWFPLRVLVCTQCWLVQTEDHAGREALFTEEYAYFSSVSQSWLAHAERYANEMIERFDLGPGSLVAEVAANDGYLLQFVQRRAVPCYGIEPTRSTAEAARQKGLEVVEEFFGVALAERLAATGRSADLTAANNVLAHVPDINDFVAGFARLLKPTGVSTFEFPHLLNLVRQAQFDTVYHEHYSYLSLSAVVRIFERNGLHVFDVTELPTHGGSLRVFAQRADVGSRALSPAVGRVLEIEREAGVTSAGFYQDFQSVAEGVKDELVGFLLDAKRQGRSVIAYGAAAKGNTLLNFGGVKRDLLPFVCDAAPSKQGKFMPGSRIPILHPRVIAQRKPDFILVLPWNIREEVESQLHFVREWGAQFVTAVPELQIR